MSGPKYALPEIERRWLVPAGGLPDLTSCRVRTIVDRYIHGGLLRLRAISEQNAETIYKLGKKYPSTPRRIVNVYLTREEYEGLLALPCTEVRKKRYSVADGALDVFELPLEHPAVFEIEFESEEAAAAYVPPAFVGEEILPQQD